MKLAMIAPHNTEIAAMGDFQFALAHEINEDNVEYYQQLSDDGVEIILDNGAFELGHPVDKEELMSVAELIGATEVVAPDMQWDPYQAFVNTSNFIDWFEEQGYHTKFKVMAVIWSAGTGDFGYWFNKYYELGVDIYGIGKYFESQYMNGTREQLIKGLFLNFDVGPERIHALGCPYANEVFRLRNHVRSMDTGIAVKAALRGYVLRDHPSARIPSLPLREITDRVRLSTARLNAKYLLQQAHAP